MIKRDVSFHARLLCGAAVVAIAAGGSAQAQDRAHIHIEPQLLVSALNEFGVKTGQPVISTPELTASKLSPGVKDADDPAVALAQLLSGTGLSYRCSGDTYLIVPSPESGPAPKRCVAAGAGGSDGADAGTVQALIVTAQKREENIQDVPIAMSAFSQEDLTKSQVTGGPDLMTQVPNMTFTKTNFSSYSIQIRGIGTQAISAAVDPAVAVAFNNTPFIRNRFFEQEFYDLQRVEVLRGPQGTLYGRNATAGVVNLISAKPTFRFEAKASADIGNYNSTRLEGMLNLPLVEDKAALRIAGAWTKRDGYDTNQLTGNAIDGRDLWSTRVSLRVTPNDRLDANLIWEHFSENDDRLRSGKQLCKTSPTPTEVLGVPVAENYGDNGVEFSDRYLDQGCDPVSLYSPESFQVPDGKVLPYYLPFNQLGAPLQGGYFSHFDVYQSTTQSHDLRVIESQIDPHYRATNDAVELNVDFDLTPSLIFTSQSGYNHDFVWSAEDYNRFNTRAGAFMYCNPTDNSGGCGLNPNSNGQLTPDPSGLAIFNDNAGSEFVGTPCNLLTDSAYSCKPAGVFCDPQIGCSDRLVAEDLSTARSWQFSQEFRLASNFSGAFNFSVGANYLRYKTVENYYVFINTLTLAAASHNPNGSGAETPWVPGVSDNHQCLPNGFDYINPYAPHDPQNDTCAYIDPNPLTSVNDEGHNYFLSKNPYKLTSYAVFGEAYYKITPELKLTAGLRWTVDKKYFVDIPSELFVAGYGYPVTGVVDQEWREPTGRLVLDWTPSLQFTDQTLVYGSFVHGYKAGGANPPGAVLLTNRGGDISVPTHPLTFDPEFVNAYEAGTKNTLLDGRLTLNLTGFYYDYTGYQISQIVDRSAINLNFDARIWGAEMEADWRPVENVRLGLKVGYEDTRVADGSKAVDLMDRTGGHSDWMLVKPFVTQASNCILPKYVVAAMLYEHAAGAAIGMDEACSISYSDKPDLFSGYAHADPATRLPYTPNPTLTWDGQPVMPGYKGFDPSTAPNNGAGFNEDLSGNALPNAPHWTTTVTGDYTVPLPNDWLMTLHGDFYYQSEAWTRIFNMPGYDRLKAYNNVNLAAIFSNEDAGWKVMAYIKNVFDKDNITGAFLNSDDSGLTTNVFLNEPRLYGLRVTKNWTGSSWWSGHAHTPGAPYPFRVELAGYYGPFSQKHELFAPATTALFPSDFPFPVGAQEDLGWGTGGGVKLTYQPDPSGWSVSAAVRYGRALGATKRHEQKPFGNICATKYGTEICNNPSSGNIYVDGTLYHQSEENINDYSDIRARNEEGHTIVDFSVGKDVGLGALSDRVNSHVEMGLRYAKLKSSSEAVLHGRPDLYLSKYAPEHGHRFGGDINAQRNFEGVGPVLNWDNAVRLFGDADKAGRVDLDIGVGGGVLFGKQTAQVRGQQYGSYRGGPNLLKYNSEDLAPPYQDLIDHSRSKSVSVPTVNANLGLSYTVGGLKISGGYRVERYYKVIDGGIAERKAYDREIDGAYAKVSIGFGG